MDDHQPYLIRWFRGSSAEEAGDGMVRELPEYARAGYVPIVQRWITLGELGAYTGVGVLTALPLQTGGVLIVTLAYRPDLTGEPTARLDQISVRPGFGPGWR